MALPTQLTGIACRRLYTPSLMLDDVFIEFDGPRIGIMGNSGSSWLPPSAFNAREEGLTVVPGFIDVHLHGACGADFLDRTAESMQTISAFAARGGATTILATTTLPVDDFGLEKFSQFVALIREANSESGELRMPGARILGLHMEGPWLNQEKRGSFGPRYMQAVNRELVERLLDVAGDLIYKVTMAPEIPGGDELLEILTSDPRSRAVVSLAHSKIPYADACHIFDTNARARNLTHAFNAMESIHHRDPQLVGAALVDDRVFVEVIPDGYHVAPALIDLVSRCKGSKRLLAVTDATGATGTCPGTVIMSLAGETTVRDGAVRKVGDDTLAGADLTMAQAAERLQKFAKLPFEQAIEMCSATPAASIGAEEIGTIDPGKRADFTVLRPDGTVAATIRDGMLVYSA